MAGLTLEEIQRRLRTFRDERDWRQFHNRKDLAAAVAVEAAELQELFLWKTLDESQDVMAERTAALEDELADVLIQCLNLADVAGSDVLAAMARKIEANAVRYPVDRARGRASKYTDL